MPKQTGFEDRLKCNEFKMPPLCAWCGSSDVIGTYPVVIDKSRVVRMKFEFLKYEDRIYCFSFPICRQCKTQIKFRRTLDNRAIQFVVVLGIITTILLSTIHRNIGFSIFAGFCASFFVFGIYLLLKNIILSSLHQVNERSWGSCDGERLTFRIQEFEKKFNELNPNIASIPK
jgi:hypothetical protein